MLNYVGDGDSKTFKGILKNLMQMSQFVKKKVLQPCAEAYGLRNLNKKNERS